MCHHRRSPSMRSFAILLIRKSRKQTVHVPSAALFCDEESYSESRRRRKRGLEEGARASAGRTFESGRGGIGPRSSDFHGCGNIKE